MLRRNLLSALALRPGGVSSRASARGSFLGVGVRLTDFWARLEQAFGAGYAASLASDQVLPQLGGRTIQEALDAGMETVVVWRAVVAAYPDRVPARLR